MYFEDAIAQCWLMDYYLSNETLSNMCRSNEGSVSSILVSITPKPVVLSQSQKYKAAFTEAQKLANLVSEVSMEKYKQRIDVLRKLVSLWEVDKNTSVIDMDVVSELNFCCFILHTYIG